MSTLKAGKLRICSTVVGSGISRVTLELGIVMVVVVVLTSFLELVISELPDMFAKYRVCVFVWEEKGRRSRCEKVFI